MATSTEVAIATTTLGSAASNITFSSIPNTYTDLRVVLTSTTSSADAVYMQFNSDTGTNYSYTVLTGDGTSASSAAQTNKSFINVSGGAGTSTTIPSMNTINVFSYANSAYKTSLINVSEDYNGSGSTRNSVGLWRSTSAITAIKLYPSGSNFATGTTATLYGIL